MADLVQEIASEGAVEQLTSAVTSSSLVRPNISGSESTPRVPVEPATILRIGEQAPAPADANGDSGGPESVTPALIGSRPAVGNVFDATVDASVGTISGDAAAGDVLTRVSGLVSNGVDLVTGVVDSAFGDAALTPSDPEGSSDAPSVPVDVSLSASPVLTTLVGDLATAAIGTVLHAANTAAMHAIELAPVLPKVDINSGVAEPVPKAPIGIGVDTLPGMTLDVPGVISLEVNLAPLIQTVDNLGTVLDEAAGETLDTLNGAVTGVLGGVGTDDGGGISIDVDLGLGDTGLAIAIANSGIAANLDLLGISVDVHLPNLLQIPPSGGDPGTDPPDTPTDPDIPDDPPIDGGNPGTDLPDTPTVPGLPGNEGNDTPTLPPGDGGDPGTNPPSDPTNPSNPGNPADPPIATPGDDDELPAGMEVQPSDAEVPMDLLPGNLEALERALGELMLQFNDLGEDLAEWLAQFDVIDLLLAAGMVGAACELIRQRRRRAQLANSRAGSGIGYSGLPGPLYRPRPCPIG